MTLSAQMVLNHPLLRFYEIHLIQHHINIRGRNHNNFVPLAVSLKDDNVGQSDSLS